MHGSWGGCGGPRCAAAGAGAGGLRLGLAARAARPAPGGSAGSAGSQQAPDVQTRAAGVSVLAQMASYQVAVAPVCVPAQLGRVPRGAPTASLGGQMHTYANVLAVGHGFTDHRPPDLTDARNQAPKTLANSLEILGDAEPTQANYNQVLNTFNVSAAISRLQGAVHPANRSTQRVIGTPLLERDLCPRPRNTIATPVRPQRQDAPRHAG